MLAIPEPSVAQEDQVRHEALALLDQELRYLPKRFRLALVLCDLEGRTRDEAARQLGWPPGTVASRLTRGRELLARRLKKHKLVFPVGGLATYLAQDLQAQELPSSLRSMTTKGLRAALSGPSAFTETLSVRVTKLMEGVMKTMLLNKLKTYVLLLLGVGIAATISGFIAHGLIAASPQEEIPAASFATLGVETDKTALPDRVGSSQSLPPAQAQKSQDRAEQLKVIMDEYQAALGKLLGDRLRRREPNSEPGPAPLRREDIKQQAMARVRSFIEADATDSHALDALLFGLQELGWPETTISDPRFFDLLASHHLASTKLWDLVQRRDAPEAFLRAVATRSPHPLARGAASLPLAVRLIHENRAAEAEELLNSVVRGKEHAAVYWQYANMVQDAEALLTDIHQLQVGKQIPELAGGKGLFAQTVALAACRGRVVLLVVWTTWRGQVTVVLPQQWRLAEAGGEQSFAVIGVKEADVPPGSHPAKPPLVPLARHQEVMVQKGMSWSAFRGFLDRELFRIHLSPKLYVQPTIYLVDHRGVIQHRLLDIPESDMLEVALRPLMVSAAAAEER